MANPTQNLGLDTKLVGGGEQMRQSLAKNFEAIDAGAMPPITEDVEEGSVLTVVDGVATWVAPGP